MATGAGDETADLLITFQHPEYPQQDLSEIVGFMIPLLRHPRANEIRQQL